MKAAPVHQEGRQAVAADGVVQQIEHAHPGRYRSGILRAAAGKHTHDHQQGQGDCKQFFYKAFPPVFVCDYAPQIIKLQQENVNKYFSVRKNYTKQQGRFWRVGVCGCREDFRLWEWQEL